MGNEGLRRYDHPGCRPRNAPCERRCKRSSPCAAVELRPEVPESPEMLTVTMFSLWTSIPTQVVEFDMTGPSCIVALVRFAPDQPTKIHDGAGHTIMSRSHRMKSHDQSTSIT